MLRTALTAGALLVPAPPVEKSIAPVILLHAFIDPFLKGETPTGMFDDTSQGGAQ